MKIFVTGVNGQLGHDVINELTKRNHKVVGSDVQTAINYRLENVATDIQYVKLDISRRYPVKSTIQSIQPDAIIHCAAWTNVDAAEDNNNWDMVDRINNLGTKYIASAARSVDAKLLYVSTDYVFDGEGERPWQPDDKCFKPLNVYGKSKLYGELAIARKLEKFFIVRTSWVFGANGNNFVNTMINVANNHDTVRVVNDQIGTPTYTQDLARLLVDMVETEKYGYYHATNSESTPGEYISWYDFCCEIYKQSNINTSVIPVSTSEYGLSRAKRPKNTRLDKSKLSKNGFIPLPDWKDALRRYLKGAKL